MFYKHWKKIALALTAFFWAGCDSTSTEAPLYGVAPCESNGCEEYKAPDSSSGETIREESSSSEFIPDDTLYGVIMPKGSSSSELMQIALDYGVPYYLDDRDTVLTYKTLCFNDSAQNVEGRVFNADILLACAVRGFIATGFWGENLDSFGELDAFRTCSRGVPQVFVSVNAVDKAPNCTSEQDICIERDPSKPIEQDSLAGCHPIIDCPEKTDITYIKVE